MCLAIPARIIDIIGPLARVDLSGNQRDISIQLTPDARVGDYVLVHAGFAIQIVEEADALETRRLLEELYAES